MKKALTITIAGTLFTIEEDAYVKLDHYLKTIQGYFGSYPDSKEIIDDIEARIAEQLLDRPNRDAVVTILDVEKLISVMGRVEDIAGESSTSKSTPESDKNDSHSRPRRLYRNPDDVWIMGLASGIAAYFDVDPLIVRIISAILIISTGVIPGTIIYFIIALVVPVAHSPTEKFQMRGGPVDLKSFKENVNEYAEHVKKGSKEFAENIKKNTEEWKEHWKHRKDNKDFFDQSSKPHEAAERVYNGFGAFLRNVVRGLVMFVGFIIKLAAVLGIIFVTFVFIALMFRAGFIGFPLYDIVSIPVYYVILTLAFLAAILPLSLLSMIGNVVMLKRQPYVLQGAIGIIGTWFAVMLLIAVLSLAYGPTISARIKALPVYQEITVDKTMDGFKNISISGTDAVEITQGESFSIIATGKQKDIENLNLTVNNETLSIDRKDESGICLWCWNQNKVTFVITMPELERIHASGVTTVRADVTSTTTPVGIELSGVSHGNISLRVPTVTVNQSGASHLEISGTTRALTVSTSGASDFDGKMLIASTTKATTSGGSHVSTHTLENLIAEASGGSSITYYGNPTTVIETSGAGSVEKSQ